ncbi:DNA-binding transcriptional regulator [Roseibium sp. RKSG952]|uniref:helix-turn-helix domain-containing protein n=1 Tax=Roseibium sp. RKSG952 TaxID=2529384 RepID=UPI0012BD3010|nr:helix-turn-helix transcriptional regulator [Roseibium sp. RKSG952]MTH94684.1 XRE family transcriptional regulator [Roseibium sp. RKSG952]
MSTHHYTECGLENVYIHGIEPIIDNGGDEAIIVQAINELHQVIAYGIVTHGQGISGDELRFLRTEMGFTQAELADVLHNDKQTVGRWERGEYPIDSLAETIIRKLVIEKLELDVDMAIGEISRRSIPTAEFQPINIHQVNDSHESHYQLAA